MEKKDKKWAGLPPEAKIEELPITEEMKELVVDYKPEPVTLNDAEASSDYIERKW